ncbi:3-hydroxyacyl-CoA dehydrogenase family protein [Oscillatoria amoena NRMC-F 0135]|nr:3-hydroxyacyl-CoA dehydrogenase family protein [Oscillatoria amoena NRMC-F 0135]
MNILVIGDPINLAECRHKFGDRHAYTFEQDHREAERFVSGSDLVFDFILDEEPFQSEIYAEKEANVFVNTAKLSLAELFSLSDHKIKANLFGFNGLPTFVNRSVLEVSVLRPVDVVNLKNLCDKLGTDFLLVEDRVGLVTPRIICMIINEAYYTVQEGTASREDIDQAMKLGTNYPHGPFEWCGLIGIKHVYELLEAVYEDTHDERYKVCPLLKREYLMVN